MADEQPEKRASTTTKQDEKFEYERLLDAANTLGHLRHVMAGAAAFHGWTPETKLTTKELDSGIKEWLRHKVEEG